MEQLIVTIELYKTDIGFTAKKYINGRDDNIITMSKDIMRLLRGNPYKEWELDWENRSHKKKAHKFKIIDCNTDDN